MSRYVWSAVLSVALGAALITGGCSTADPQSSPGKTIFDTGNGHAGAIARSMMGGPNTTDGLPCAGCHGAHGQGTGIGPSITAATLGATHTITHKPSASDPAPQPVTEGPWTPQQTVAVVRTGVTPEGHHLGGRMPKWQLDPQDASALAAYLGQL
jgi:mono/diheme cytochrome c family protein